MFDKLLEKVGKNKVIIVVAALAILDVLVYIHLLARNPNITAYFLDVGQGDSALVRLEGTVDVLIDGGPPNNRVVRALGDVLPFIDRYIDVVLITHVQSDHIGGLIEVLRRYNVGVVLWNGVGAETAVFQELYRIIQERNIPFIVVGVGDTLCYRSSCFIVLAPSEILKGASDMNDTSVVVLLKNQDISFLFTGDISTRVERLLREQYYLSVDVLKVAHHGSRYSSSEAFLSAIRPKVAVISVGRNSYGHPTSETLKRLANVGAQVLRTDMHGTVRIVLDKQTLHISKGR